ncbi:hypothetical protein GXP67_17390 [Rhodocytophaga rosea]|uniref:T9SS type A sorting domain-containing protein n=1 Tax=Rhodocytophaga rosea TaxID=2704465 RepID=A0A6C0GJX0_9BACT|nr:hypothetical protein [Rhodocytophaga rosea]QHT68285.1 hypothetical protein GXP67_17390 [Rhodocytophaga rosea]
MKTLFASLFIALTVSASSLTFAHSSSDPLPLDAAVVVRAQDMKIDVITQAGTQENIVIRLKDADGHTLTKTTVEQSEKASLSRFDVSNLSDGVYKVEISDGITKQVKDFTIQTTIPTTSVERTISLPAL